MPALSPDLIKKLAPLFNEINREFFFTACVSQVLEGKLEDSSLTMTDVGFTEKELDSMKKTKIAKIKFEDNPEDTSKFRIKIGDGENDYILFSNREGATSTSELRGENLRRVLSKLAVETPDKSLYDTLTMLEKDPSNMVTVFYGPLTMLTTPSDGTDSDTTFESALMDQENKKILIKALTGLANMYIARIENGRKLGKTDKDLKNEIIAEMGKNMENLLTLFIRAAETDQTENLIISLTFIDEIKSKYGDHNEIMTSITAAKELLEIQLINKPQSEIATAKTKFENAMNNIKIEKFVGLRKLFSNLIESLKNLKSPSISLSKIPSWIKNNAYAKDEKATEELHSKIKQTILPHDTDNSDKPQDEPKDSPMPAI